MHTCGTYWAHGSASVFPRHAHLQPVQVKSSGDATAAVEVPRFDANWDNVHLRYRLEWPMGLLITPAVLARCARDERRHVATYGMHASTATWVMDGRRSRFFNSPVSCSTCTVCGSSTEVNLQD